MAALASRRVIVEYKYEERYKLCKPIEIEFGRQLSEAFKVYLDFTNSDTNEILHGCLSEAISKANGEWEVVDVEYSDSDEDAAPAEAAPAETAPAEAKKLYTSSSEEDDGHSSDEEVTIQQSELVYQSELDYYIELFTNMNSEKKVNVFDVLNMYTNGMDIVLWYFFNSTSTDSPLYRPLFYYMRTMNKFIADYFTQLGPETRVEIIHDILEREKKRLEEESQAARIQNNTNNLRLRF